MKDKKKINYITSRTAPPSLQEQLSYKISRTAILALKKQPAT
jgi:hypothetical protein